MRRLLSLAAAAALVAAPHVAPAQTFPTNDPVIQRIWALGMDSSHTYSLSQTLFDSLGPRLMGAPNLKAAQDWLVKLYQSWGIDAHNEQYGTWRGESTPRTNDTARGEVGVAATHTSISSHRACARSRARWSATAPAPAERT